MPTGELQPGQNLQPGQKYIVQPTRSTVTYMAGIYRFEDRYPRFSILTRGAVGGLKEIHNQMPVMLPEDLIAEWINPDLSTRRVKELAASSLTSVVVEKAE